MKILGLQSWASHEPAAAILSDDGDGSELVSALATEERLLRCKNSYQFPAHALVDCMDRLGIESLREIDYLATTGGQSACRRGGEGLGVMEGGSRISYRQKW